MCHGAWAKSPLRGFQHTLSPTTKHTDAGRHCFVPGNLSLDNFIVKSTTGGHEGVRPFLFSLGRWRNLGDSAGAQPPLNLGLQVFAQSWRHDAGRGQFLQIRRR